MNNTVGAAAVCPSFNFQECTRADCRWYTSHYCEENSLRLCNHLLGRAESDGVQLSVVFVSNAARQVPVWFQRLADRRDEPVLWDYHGKQQPFYAFIAVKSSPFIV